MSDQSDVNRGRRSLSSQVPARAAWPVSALPCLSPHRCCHRSAPRLWARRRSRHRAAQSREKMTVECADNPCGSFIAPRKCSRRSSGQTAKSPTPRASARKANSRRYTPGMNTVRSSRSTWLWLEFARTSAALRRTGSKRVRRRSRASGPEGSIVLATDPFRPRWPGLQEQARPGQPQGAPYTYLTDTRLLIGEDKKGT